MVFGFYAANLGVFFSINLTSLFKIYLIFLLCLFLATVSLDLFDRIIPLCLQSRYSGSLTSLKICYDKFNIKLNRLWKNKDYLRFMTIEQTISPGIVDKRYFQ